MTGTRAPLRLRRILLTLLVCTTGPARLRAQQTDTSQSHSAAHTKTSLPASAARLAVPILGATVGSHIAGAPEVWARTPRGFAQRLGDQAGFFVVEESLAAMLRHRTGWRSDARRCPNALTVLPCASARVLRVQSTDGRTRWNLPLLAGVVAGTAVSLAWRPERQQSGEDLGRFVATRIGLSVGIPILGRAVREWRSEGPRTTDARR